MLQFVNTWNVRRLLRCYITFTKSLVHVHVSVYKTNGIPIIPVIIDLVHVFTSWPHICRHYMLSYMVKKKNCSGSIVIFFFLTVDYFKIPSMYFHYYIIISPWKRAGPFIWTDLNPLHLRMLCAKFRWKWPSGSGEEDF